MLETLRTQLSDLEVYVTGYGHSGTFPKWMKDLRIVEHDPQIERTWAKVSAMSHLAIGVPDVYKLCEDVTRAGGKVTRPAGPVKFGTTVIAFVEDPDGYKIELIERKG